MTLTITFGTIFSWPVGLILLVLSITALLTGTLPDNPHRPVGDAVRMVVWPVFFVWILGAVIRGIV